MRPWSTASATVLVVVVIVFGGLLSGARCAGATAIDEGCPDLESLCPALACVEQATNDDGCPVCECRVQACLIEDDCEARDPPQRCDIRPSVCEPPSGCTDNDDDTPCGAACFGRCTPRGVTADGAFCIDARECIDPDAGCRFDNRFCVIDEVDHPGTCVGWCVAVCDDAITCAIDPQSRQLFKFDDGCTPPGFEQVSCE